MHEIYLVRNILNTVEELFPDTPPEKIKSIHIRAGEMSNVQPILMKNAFQAVVQEDPRYQRATLEVEVTPILIHCMECDKTTQVKNYTFVCECGRPSKNIIQGDELQLSDVDFF